MFERGLTRFIGLEFEYGENSDSASDDDDILEEWSLVSQSSSTVIGDEAWVSVEQDNYGNLYLESIDVEEEVANPAAVQRWDVLQEDYTVILSTDKKAKRKLDRKARVETLAVGVSTIALASVMPTSSFILPFLLLNSVDLIKLGAKGRISKLPLEQRDASIRELLRRIAVKNSQLSAVSLASATASRMALSTIPVPLILLEQLTFAGLDVSTFELAERAISGAVCSFSSNIYLAKQKHQLTQDRKHKKVMKKAVWGGVSGAASGMIGPVLNSPVAEKCVMEACAASVRLSEQVLTYSL